MTAIFAISACAFALTGAAFIGGKTAEIQLTPGQDFTPSDGREMSVPAWRINAAIATRVIERFSKRQNPAVLDYEHQTLRKESNGQLAPAAGWLRSLQWREGSGLWATVELTERAADFIRQGEYKFISPVFAYDASTGEVLAITMAAITNNPAIDGMEPLALRAAASAGFIDGLNQEYPMTALTSEEIAICAALGIEQSAFIATRQTKTGEEMSGLSEHEVAICRATGITPAQFFAARSR